MRDPSPLQATRSAVLRSLVRASAYLLWQMLRLHYATLRLLVRYHLAAHRQLQDLAKKRDPAE